MDDTSSLVGSHKKLVAGSQNFQHKSLWGFAHLQCTGELVSDVQLETKQQAEEISPNKTKELNHIGFHDSLSSTKLFLHLEKPIP
jgi:hypothetical protein